MSAASSTHQPYELTAWVVLATDGLVAPARERIKQEIEAHYADAVVKHVAAGLTQAAAEAQALDELGDINVAAKGFRKRYLTEKEEAWLCEFVTRVRPLDLKRKRFLAVVTGVAIVLLAGLAMLLWRIRPRDLDAFELHVLWGSMVFVGVLLTSVIAAGRKFYCLATRHPPGIELRRKLLALSVVLSRISLLGCLTGPLFLSLQKSSFHPIYAGVGTLLVLALTTPFDRRFRLLRKLRYAQVAGDTGVAA